MKFVTRLCLPLLLALTGPALAQVPIEHFARLPATQGLSISPDGTRIAFIVHAEDRRLMVVENLDTGEQVAAAADDLRVLSTRWAGNDTVLARVSTVIDVDYVRGDIDLTAFITFDADTLESRELIERQRLSGINFDSSRIAGRDPQSGHLLMPLRDQRGRLNLSVVNPATGSRSRTIARGSTTTQYWIADPAAERFVEVRFSRRESRFSIILEEGAGNQTLYSRDAALMPLQVEGFAEDGDLIISRTFNAPPYTRQLQRLDPQSGEFGEVLFHDPQYDFETVRLDHHSGHVAGVVIDRENTETVWLDEELAQRQRALENAFPGMTVSLVDWSEDRQRFVVRTETSGQPPIYFLVDFSISDARAIKLAYPELFEVPLASRELISYTARDGTQIPAYLAVPAGDGPKSFVILAHGGPAARDLGGFDYLAHFLADRGYGVIQPQFRGSGGFGVRWEIAGRGEWGTGLMQTDVSDAVAYLMDEGLASQVCIVGASYGGYAAMAGAAFTPDLYDCAISINGVSDLPQFLDYVSDRFGTDSQAVRYWNRSISGSISERASMDALTSASPSRQAAAVTIPVLLLHGQDDTVVPFTQSRRMSDSLQRSGGNVELIELPGGDHWLWEYQSRLRVLQEIERFLSMHLEE